MNLPSLSLSVCPSCLCFTSNSLGQAESRHVSRVACQNPFSIKTQITDYRMGTQAHNLQGAKVFYIFFGGTHQIAHELAHEHIVSNSNICKIAGNSQNV